MQCQIVPLYAERFRGRTSHWSRRVFPGNQHQETVSSNQLICSDVFEARILAINEGIAEMCSQKGVREHRDGYCLEKLYVVQCGIRLQWLKSGIGVDQQLSATFTFSCVYC